MEISTGAGVLWRERERERERRRRRRRLLMPSRRNDDF
jgi:hypothetical protein